MTRPGNLKERILARLDIAGFYRNELTCLKNSRGEEAIAFCPFHDDRNTPNLSVNLKTSLFHCFACGAKGNIFTFYQNRHSCDFKTALNDLARIAGIDPEQAEGPSKFTLQDFSEFKRLPVDFLLKSGVRERTNGRGSTWVEFPYFDQDKKIVAVKRRFNQAEKGKFRRGDKITLPFGFWNLKRAKAAGWVLLVEGETDTLTAWFSKIPALGLPGKNNWKSEWAAHLQGLQVYIWQEPDAPELPGKVAKDLPTLLVIPAPAGIKDISEAHLQGQDVAALIADLKSQARPPAPSEPEKISWVGHLFFVEHGRLCLEVIDREGRHTRPLANFQARIEEEITRDDGLRPVREFLVRGSLETGRPLPPARIPAREFEGLAWIRREWGAEACQAPARSLGPHLVNAIQAHSQGLKKRIVYAHSGWRKINGVWLYLHGGGAIGQGEPVEVDLGENLHLYRLSEPGGIEAAQASLKFLDIAPWEITAPLISCAYLAPFADLEQIDFSLWIYGPTGGLKSTLAALALSHFGKFSRTTLPGSWFSTANSLEKLTFILKDSLCVIDDFILAANFKESHLMTEKAARIIYQAGNLSGRGRLSADLSVRPTHYPRCLIISTGEILLPGQRQSATARYLGIELDPKKIMIDKARLTAAQAEAHLYPGAMAAYLADLAPRLEDVQAEIRELWEGYREAFQSTAHLRIPEIQAWLTVGFEMFLRFQTGMGTISQGQADEMLKRAWKVFEDLGEKHSRVIEGERPTLKFLAVLKELFYQGRIYVESATLAGAPPQRKDDLGWAGTEPARGAEFVGWADDSTIYLMPETALRVVNEAIRRQGDFLSLGKNEMLAALAREGFIEPGKDSQQGRNTHVKKIQGTSKRVICLPLEKLAHDEALEDETL